MNRIRTAAVLLFLLLATLVRGQELDCTITIKTDGMPSDAIQNLTDFVQQTMQYMNSYRWTNVDLGGEKIKCRIDMQFATTGRQNHYAVKAFVGSERPIFESQGRSTALLRLLDDKWEFDYIRGTSLAHNDMLFDPLLSCLDFYAWVILGYDFESYRTGDGSPFFQKAQDLVNRAHSTGNAGPGWDIPADNVYSRELLIDELTNAKLNDLRIGLYKYHYKGLDLLAKDEVRARKNMMAALEKIGTLSEKINNRSLIIRLFFETKYLEIAQTFSKDPDLTVWSRLEKIDPTHQSDYERYKNGGQ
ncbi:MAG TPA: DUF4835 family protein [Bacteroidota bacterium]|nr:DUF4835 family protein [Bacteroidota bacterium]